MQQALYQLFYDDEYTILLLPCLT